MYVRRKERTTLEVQPQPITCVTEIETPQAEPIRPDRETLQNMASPQPRRASSRRLHALQAEPPPEKAPPLTSLLGDGSLEACRALDLRAATPADLRAALRPFASAEFPVDQLAPERLMIAVELARQFADLGAEVVGAMLPLTVHPAATIGVQGVDNLRHINLVFRNAARGEDSETGVLRELAASVGTDLLGKGGTDGLPIIDLIGLSPLEAVRAMVLPQTLAGEDPAKVAELLARSSKKKGALGELAAQFRRLTTGRMTPDDTILATRQREIDRALEDVSPEASAVLRPLLAQLKSGAINLGQLFGALAAAKNPEASKIFNARLMNTQAFLKFLPALSGTFNHNYTHPQVTFELAKKLGLSDQDAIQAACEQIMHGFGCAFVASGYPALPDFRSVRFEGGLRFTEEQIAHLEAVGRAAIIFAQELTIPAEVVAAHPEWNFPAGIPPPAGFQNIGAYANNHNGGVLPASLIEYLGACPETRAFVRARREAGVLSRQADVDNDSNFGGASIGKWLGIMKNTIGDTKETRLGDLLGGIKGRHQGLIWPANMYRAEQQIVSPNGTAAFDFLFGPSAGALGLIVTPGGYATIYERRDDGSYRVRDDAPATAVRAAADALRAATGARGEDRALLEELYSRKLDGAVYDVLVRIGSAGVDLDR